MLLNSVVGIYMFACLSWAQEFTYGYSKDQHNLLRILWLPPTHVAAHRALLRISEFYSNFFGKNGEIDLIESCVFSTAQLWKIFTQNFGKIKFMTIFRWNHTTTNKLTLEFRSSRNFSNSPFDPGSDLIWILPTRPLLYLPHSTWRYSDTFDQYQARPCTPLRCTPS